MLLGRIGISFAVSVLAIAGLACSQEPARHVEPVAASCSPGAHSLSHAGDVIYPETGNGGYTSVHTDIHLRYDTGKNQFLAGTHVDLTDKATHCLTDFSLDFEHSQAGNPAGSPQLTVDSITVNGKPAKFAFVQPTYPGDPKGQDDPDPRAHQASQTNPVGGPDDNPLPPACSPQLGEDDDDDALNGTECPANKLLITPQAPIDDGTHFTVTVNYTGNPGLHRDAEGATEGWYTTPGGSSMTSEPLGTEAWMPLNSHPSAKPTYDFYETAATGKTVLCNGQLAGKTDNKADGDFPDGSTTWHWHAAMPIASYLVESIIGDYQLSERTADDGIKYYEAQDRHIGAAQQKKNVAVMDKHEDITGFESIFNGPYPYASDGVVAGIPGTSDDVEEMQTMIVFTGGKVDTDTLYHETMHQWWGDNVTESNYNMTFFKEGLATLGEDFLAARDDAGGASDGSKFEQSLIDQFNDDYGSGGDFWTVAPSKPSPSDLFDDDYTYTRPGDTYLALYRILGRTNFIKALKTIQQTYGGATITEPQLEAGFRQFMPNQSGACKDRLNKFFSEWFDTGYPAGGGDNRPQITGPGLAGSGFDGDGCTL